MPLLPKEEIIIPAKVLDKLWITHISIDSPSPSGEANAVVQLLPYNDGGDTGPEFPLVFSDIFAKIDNGDEDLKDAFRAITLAVQKQVYPELFEVAPTGEEAVTGS